MTAREFTFRNPGSQLGFSERMANLGDTNIFYAPEGTNANPLAAEDWYLFGIVTGEATISPNIEKYEVITGSPQSRKASLKTSQMDSMTFEVSHLTLGGYSLGYANEVAPTFTKAADGQTTVSSSTDAFTTVLASAANIAPGDVCVIGDPASAVPQLAFIETVIGNTVTHNLLSQQPSASDTFEKLAGQQDAATTGIQFNSGGCRFPRFEICIVRYLHCSKNMFIQHRPKASGVSTDGFVFSPTEPGKVNVTFDFIDIGSATNGINYGNDYFVPFES